MLGLDNFAIEVGHPRQLIDNLPPLPGVHGNDAGHVPLQHHVVALGIDPQLREGLVQLAEGAGFAANVVVGGVGSLLGDAQFAGDSPFTEGLAVGIAQTGQVFGGFGGNGGQQGGFFAQIKGDSNGSFYGRSLAFALALAHLSLVYQVGQAIGPHSFGGGEAEGKQQRIENVGFTGAVGARNHGESGQQGNSRRAAKGFEVRDFNLLDIQRAGDRSRGGLQGRGRRKQRSTALSYPKLSRNGDRLTIKSLSYYHRIGILNNPEVK